MATQTITQRTAARMRDLLSQRGMTQEQLSEETGIPMRTLSRLLHKTNPAAPDLERLDVLAHALGIGIADLIAPCLDARPSPHALAAGAAPEIGHAA